MPVATLVKFVQGASVGTPGVSLIGVTGTGVQVSNGGTNPTPDPGTWVFAVLGVPSASAVPTGVVQSGSTPTWNFTPDVPGTYVVQLEVTDDTTGATSTDVRSFGIYTSLGAPYLIPAFTGNSQSMNFGGQPTGWDKYMEAWLNLVTTLAAPTQVHVVSPGSQTAQGGYEYFVDLHAAGGNVTIVTSSLVAGDEVAVTLIDPAGAGTGGFSVTIEPITAGNHIDATFPPTGPSSPGTLTTSAVLTAVGESIRLATFDGINLWSAP